MKKMKVPTGYNYEFSVKAPQATKKKHSPEIRRMKERYNVKYDDIIEYRFGYDVMDRISIDPNFSWLRERIIGKGHLTKTDLREIKKIVNRVTRKAIKEILGINNIPVSYDIAFYMAYYPKVNALMKKIAKEIIRDYI